MELGRNGAGEDNSEDGVRWVDATSCGHLAGTIERPAADGLASRDGRHGLSNIEFEEISHRNGHRCVNQRRLRPVQPATSNG